jgi:hypothetical protein
MPRSSDLYHRAPGLLGTEAGRDAVLMDIGKGSYLTLNESGATIWKLLEHPATQSQIVDRLCAAFDIDAAECARRIEPFLDEMLKKGVLEVRE